MHDLIVTYLLDYLFLQLSRKQQIQNFKFLIENLVTVWRKSIQVQTRPRHKLHTSKT